VRYSTISGINNDSDPSTQADWSFDVIPGATGAPGEALFRYRMAAYLVGKYDFSSGSETAANRQVQRAIWSVLDIDPDGAYQISDLDGPGELWEEARNYVNNTPNVNWANFTVYSGFQTGSKLKDRGSDQVQTYIEVGAGPGLVVPEPSAAFLLLSGVALLAGGRTLRRFRL
jgi:hypothetical protein